MISGDEFFKQSFDKMLPTVMRPRWEERWINSHVLCRKDNRDNSLVEELERESADTRAFTSWPLGFAAPSDIWSSFVRHLSRDTDG